MFPTPIAINNKRTIHVLFNTLRPAYGVSDEEWTDVVVRKMSYGLEVCFNDGSEYVYPWHIVDRVRITGVEHGDPTESESGS